MKKRRNQKNFHDDNGFTWYDKRNPTYLAMILQSKDGLIIEIKVQPGARKEEITRWKEGILYIKVRENPENGKANSAVLEFLSEIFSIPLRDILLLQGKTSRCKKILCKGLSEKVFLQIVEKFA